MPDGVNITPANKWMRIVLFVVSVAAFAYCVSEALLLYRERAPFHQMYSDATPAENVMVTRRLFAALVGMPLFLALGVVAVRWRRLFDNPRRWLRWLFILLILASFQGCAAFASLPYGFGSGYEHVKPEQAWHMKISTRVGFIALGGALLVFGLTPKKGRKTVSVMDAPGAMR